MNVEQQQQQLGAPFAVGSPQAPLSLPLPPPPPSLLTTEVYGGYSNIVNTNNNNITTCGSSSSSSSSSGAGSGSAIGNNATTNETFQTSAARSGSGSGIGATSGTGSGCGSTSVAAATTLATTFVTISMMPPPPPPTLPSIAGSGSLGTPMTTTSTFKTPLLPMPSLEDIEGGIVVPMQTQQHHQQQSHQQQQSLQQQQPYQQQQYQQQQPIPGGILKYPTNAIPISVPIEMGLSPPPLPLSLPSQAATGVTGATVGQINPPQQQQQSPATLGIGSDASTCGTLQSNATLLLATSPQQQQQQQQTVATTTPLAPAATSMSLLPQMQATSTGSTITTSRPYTGQAPATNLNRGNPAGVRAASCNNSNNSSSNSVQQKSASKCCGCFGGNDAHKGNYPRGPGSGSGSGSSSMASKSKKKRKQKTQSMWSALLTNLGICALLLAYTLLGSFIFLTIESEDTSSLLLHQQRTLASTKRVSIGGRGINSHNNNNNNIYHTPHQLDNGTMAAVASSSSTAGAGAGAGADAAASSSRERLTHSSNGNNNDFTYGGGNPDMDGIAGGIGDGSPQLALSADTYDVRQRTIENIWDITVSLNILYKENWTKLAALEIAKFQDQLIKRLNEDALLQLSHMDINGDSDNDDDGDGDGDGAAGQAGTTGVVSGGRSGGAGAGGGNSPATEAVLLHAYGHHGMQEWDFAKAFLYSLTVLTTIGYGNIAPRTTLGRLVTLIYALFGIPLTLVYLSSTGGILAKIAREVFSKALCCCLCSNCGYCCYDERRMAEKERRTKRKRQQAELRKQQQQQQQQQQQDASMQEPYYVRSGDSYQPPEKGTPTGQLPPDIDSLSASESRGSMHGLSILAPILLCLSMMIVYILFGAVVLYRLEEWPLLDGVYFCFMSLSTIGFGDMLPGLRRESTATTWFCSVYIMSGMALTAMCFNVIHEEIVHRIKIVVEFKKASALDGSSANDDQGSYYMPP